MKFLFESKLGSKITTETKIVLFFNEPGRRCLPIILERRWKLRLNLTTQAR
jgi:hypothetical protein